jgi:hypothetical protein
MDVFVLGAFVAAYAAPTFVALGRRRETPGPTIVVNLLLGWTVIGWVVALAMAVGGNVKPIPPWTPEQWAAWQARQEER